MRRTAFLIAAWLLVVLAPAAMAQVNSLPKVQAQLIPERSGIAPGETVTVALEEVIRPGWHTYWKNPGDAGAPTEIHWSLPDGWRAGQIAWPYPKNLPVGPLMNYGYEGKVWLLVDLTAPKSAVPGQTVTLKAAVDWLVCQEVCVPENTSLTLPLSIVANPTPIDPEIAADFAAARAKLPVLSPWPIRYRLTDQLKLFVQAPSLAKAQPSSAAFFPDSGDVLKASAPQTFGTARGGIVLTLTAIKRYRAAAPLTGVLVLTSSDGSVEALDVKAREGLVPEAAFMHESGMTLSLALLFAFLGGLILNLMPCVLPILAMKALALANHAVAHRDETRAEGLSYGIGAILSFVTLGLLLVTLRSGGAAIGWGFQLQEPIVVAGFALLMFAVGLNLSGVYEINPVAAGESLVRTGGTLGAFFTGVLAVAVAAPCTVPFMAAALGFALTQPTPVALATFLALGVGFAAPFILLGIWPSLIARILPRPGAWMKVFREALAFPMYAAAAWLIWVLAQQTNATGVLATLAALVLFAFAMWLWSTTRMLATRRRAIGTLATLVFLIASFSSLAVLRNSSPTPQITESSPLAIAGAEPYTEKRLTDLRAQHRAVFVDATAAWCITCLVNEDAVLSRPAVQNAFAANHVAVLVADWTNRNPEITALLTTHGRSGVPLYLYYAPNAPDAAVLPQILTEGDVLDAVAGKSK